MVEYIIIIYGLFECRYGSSEVCLDHCCVLVEVLHHTNPTSPQHLAVTALLARLTTKLTPQHHQHLSHTLSSSTGIVYVIDYSTLLCFIHGPNALIPVSAILSLV